MNTSTLCDDTVIHSIMQAMDGADERTLRLISDSLADWPKDHRLWFLRGSTYASAGRHPEARVDFMQTIALAPDFHIARFMLGLLELMEQRALVATVLWERLDQLPDTDALRLFKNGLIALGQDRFEESRELLRLGLAADQSYPHIAPYIRAIVEQIDARFPPDGTGPATEETSVVSGNHLFLSSYMNDNTRH